jgi:ribosomal protein L11 methylase PrmA
MKSRSEAVREGASFRDPSGFVFYQDGTPYRQINQFYREDYRRLMDSGLYQELVGAQLLLPHEEVDLAPPLPELAYQVIRPELVAFLSYPYEWCFGQLKDAALLTLEAQELALRRDMSLKDASAFNVQFRAGRPILIDSLSFERLKPGEPWIAYRQFCQHFLAPLALMSKVDVRLGQWSRLSVEGVPLDLASRLLPWRTRLSFPLQVHLHLHARAQRRYAGEVVAERRGGRAMGKPALLGLVSNLRAAVRGLKWEPAGTAWADYGETRNYTARALEAKRDAVERFLERARPSSVWDLGANTGEFSRTASRRGALTLAFDFDHGAVELNYRQARAEGDEHLLPLLQDLTNPSPGAGWSNRERRALLERAPAEAVMALALIHHLAIANNLPLEMVAEFLSRLGRWLIIEFVPKQDPQVRRLLANRQDIFEGYHREGFEEAFGTHYRLRDSRPLPESERWMYLMEAKSR